MTNFERETAVRSLGDGSYEADLHDNWWVVRGPHGGYLAAIILRAIEDAQGDGERPIRSLTTHFVAAPKTGAVTIETRVEKVGRSATYMSARVVQEGRPVALALAAFSTPWRGFEFDDAPMPDVKRAEDGLIVPNAGDGIPAFVGNFDMRWVLGDPPYSGASAALVGGWIRMADPTLVDAPAMACLLDAWAPAVFPRADRPVVAPTMDMTMHFRSPLPLANAAPDDFYLGRFTSRLGRQGFFEEDGEIWASDGTLIAQSRQLALALTVD